MLGKEGAQTGSEGSQSRLSSEWADKRDWQGPDVTADEATNESETGRWHTQKNCIRGASLEFRGRETSCHSGQVAVDMALSWRGQKGC